MTIEELKQKAIKLGASDLGVSKRKDKKYYVIYNDKKINFGSASGKTFLDHHDTKKQTNFKKRHEAIKNDDGVPFYTIKDSASFWAYNLLW